MKARQSHGKSHIYDIEKYRKNQKSVAKKPLGKPFEHYYLSESTLSRSQMVTLFFLALVIVDQVATSEKTDDSAQDKKLTKKELMKEKVKPICKSQDINTINKLNMTLGIQNQLIVPFSCVLKEPTCTADNLAYRSYMNGGGMLKIYNKFDKQYREKHKTFMKQWVADMQLKTSHLPPIISTETIRTYEKIVNEVMTIVSFAKTAEYTKKAKRGNCGEHTALEVMKLLQVKETYGLSLKVQKVSVKNSKSTDMTVDHVYILLDSDLTDGTVAGAAKVKATLKSIKKGIICDSWNNIFVNFKKDKTGFYDANAGWDELNVTTITLEFKEINKLPKPHRALICDELAKVGLSPSPKAICEPTKTETPRVKKVDL